jgi:hypothetical protein
MENVDIFYDHLEYCTVILVILGQFGIVCGHVVHFSRFGMFGPRKIWQSWCKVSAKPSLKKTPPNADSGDRCVNFKLRLRNIAFVDLGEHYIQTYIHMYKARLPSSQHTQQGCQIFHGRNIPKREYHPK